jgi:hypothetical protein
MLVKLEVPKSQTQTGATTIEIIGFKDTKDTDTRDRSYLLGLFIVCPGRM